MHPYTRARAHTHTHTHIHIYTQWHSIPMFNCVLAEASTPFGNLNPTAHHHHRQNRQDHHQDHRQDHHLDQALLVRVIRFGLTQRQPEILTLSDTYSNLELENQPKHHDKKKKLNTTQHKQKATQTNKQTNKQNTSTDTWSANAYYIYIDYVYV